MKYLIAVLLIIGFCSSSFGQLRKRPNQVLKVRHVMGAKSFEIGGGVSGYGVYGNAYFSEFFLDNTYYKIGGGYEYRADKGNIKYSSSFADALVGYTVLDRGQVFMNLLGGATGAMDNVTNIDTPKTISAFVYGPVVGAEFEWFLMNNVVFVINGTQRFILQNSFGNRYYVGVALRFKL